MQHAAQNLCCLCVVYVFVLHVLLVHVDCVAVCTYICVVSYACRICEHIYLSSCCACCLCMRPTAHMSVSSCCACCLCMLPTAHILCRHAVHVVCACGLLHMYLVHHVCTRGLLGGVWLCNTCVACTLDDTAWQHRDNTTQLPIFFNK